MLRIEKTQADAAMASLAMAVATLKAGNPTAALAALEVGHGLLQKGLEPSRSPRGQARPDSVRRQRSTRKTASTGTSAPTRSVSSASGQVPTH